MEPRYNREGNWREDADLAWNDYLWGDFDRSTAAEEEAKDKLFKLLMKARDIQLISVGRSPRTPGFLIEEAEGSRTLGESAEEL